MPVVHFIQLLLNYIIKSIVFCSHPLNKLHALDLQRTFHTKLEERTLSDKKLVIWTSLQKGKHFLLLYAS